jgi:hypothetical protein
MAKTTLKDIRTRADQIQRRYQANYAGHPRISRDADALEKMVKQLDLLLAHLKRLPANQQMQMSRTLRENRNLYAKEVKAIRQAQANGPETMYAHHLASWANFASARYRRNFAGQNRATRDALLLGEMIDDLERLVPLIADQRTRVDSDELKTAHESAQQNLNLYRSERDAVLAAQRDGTPEQQADLMARLANDQFKLYADHFAGKSRISRRPALIERMINNLDRIQSRMQALADDGLTEGSNTQNIEIVKGRLDGYRKELEEIRNAKSGGGFDDMVNALGEAANAIFAEYRENFAGQDRGTRDLDLMNRLCEGLFDIARQMDDLDRVRDHETNQANLGIVLDNLRMYDREFDQIRTVQQQQSEA